MPLNTKTDEQFIQDFCNQFSGVTGFNPVYSTGSRVLGLATASAGVASFLQYQAQFDTFFARSTTSTGPDLDSWMAQFSFARAGATYAEGQVTLSVPSPASIQLVIPAATVNSDGSIATNGAVIQASGGAIQYTLIPDTNQTAYNVGLNSYVLGVGQTSITATAQALVIGSASNVLAGQLNQFSSSSYGLTGVTNLASIESGTDSESDAAYRQRFILYINSLSKGTYQAILEACLSTYDEFTYTLLANTTPWDATVYGFFTVIANNPGQVVSSGQLLNLTAAVNAIRAFTIAFEVVAPTIVKPAIAANISVSGSQYLTASETAAQIAVIGYVNSLLPGQKLYLTDIIDVIINSSSYITSVQFSSVTIRGTQVDYTPADQFHIVQADLSTVAIASYDG